MFYCILEPIYKRCYILYRQIIMQYLPCINLKRTMILSSSLSSSSSVASLLPARSLESTYLAEINQTLINTRQMHNIRSSDNLKTPQHQPYQEISLYQDLISCFFKFISLLPLLPWLPYQLSFHFYPFICQGLICFFVLNLITHCTALIYLVAMVTIWLPWLPAGCHGDLPISSAGLFCLWLMKCSKDSFMELMNFSFWQKQVDIIVSTLSLKSATKKKAQDK